MASPCCRQQPAIFQRSYRQLFRNTELFLPISKFWETKLQELGAPKDKLKVFRMGIAVPENANDNKSLHCPLT